MDDSQLRILIEAQNRASKTLEEVQRDVKKMSESAKKDIQSMGDAANNTKLDGFKSMVSSAGQGLLSFGKTLANLAWQATVAGAIAATAALGGLSTVGLKAGMDLQKTQTGIVALTGSMDTANDLMKDFYGFAASTPFEFPDIAKAGQILLGFGRTAEQAKGDVRTLGNISAATGADFNSLALVFGQVNAAGKLMGQDALQLINNNVPITGILAKKLGVDVAEVKKRMEEGAISAQMFNEAIKEFAPPDALEKMAQTLPGRLSTLQDSLTALGFSFVGINTSFEQGSQLVTAGGLFDVVTKAVQDLSAALGDPALNTAMGSLGTSLGQTVGGLVGLIQPLIPAVSSIAAALVSAFNAVVPGIAAVLSGLLPGLNVFMGALSTGFQSLTPVITQLGGVIGGTLSTVFTALAPAIQPIVTALQTLIPVVGTVIAALAPFIAQLIGALAPILPPIANAIKALVEPLVSALQPILPVISATLAQLAGAFGQIITALTPLLPPLMQLAGTIITQLLLPILPLIVTLVQLFASVITMVANALMPLMPSLMQLATTLITALAPILPTVVQLFLQLIQALLPILPPILQLITTLLPPLVSFLSLVIQVASILSNILSAVLVGAIGAVIQVLRVIITYVSQVITAFGSFQQRISQAATGAMNQVGGALNGIVQFFANLPSRILGALGNLGNMLIGAGRNIVEGLRNGISGAAGMVVDKVKEIAKGALDAVKSFFGIKSPSRLMAQMGSFIMQGLGNGLESMRRSVVSTAQSISDDVAAGLNTEAGFTYSNGGMTGSAVSAASRGNAVQYGGNTTSTTNQFMGQIILPTPQAVEAFYDRIDRDGELAAMGVPT